MEVFDTNEVVFESELSEGQLGLWFFQNRNPLSTAYNTFFSAKFDQDISRDKISAFSKWISKKHPILSATFVETATSVKMKLTEKEEIFLEILQLDNREDVKKRFENEVNTPIDLKVGPISKICFAATENGEKYILLLSHHIILDYWSLILILKEMKEFFEDESLQYDVVVPEYRYFEAIKKNQEFKKSERFQKSIEYWEQVLTDAVPTLKLPYGIVPQPDQKAKVQTEMIKFDETITSSIYSCCRQIGVTPFVFLLANYHITLSYYFNENDISTGVPFLGRYSKMEIESVGYYANTLPIRERISENTSFSEYAKNINARIKKAFANQRVTLQEMQKKNDINKSDNYFQTMFILEKANIKSFEGASLLTVGIEDVSVKLGKYMVNGFPIKNKDQICGITVMLERFEDTIMGNIIYREDLYPEHYIKSFIEFFINCVKETIQNSQILVGSLKHPIECERKIIEIANRQGEESRIQGSVAGQLEEVIHKFGNRVAISQGNFSESYHELGKVTTAIAEMLINQCGNGKKRYVVLCSNKRNILHGIVGAVRAGGSYIALDDSFPVKRLEDIIIQLQPAAILFDKQSQDKLEKIEITQIVKKISIENITISDRDFINSTEKVLPEDELYCIFTSGTSGNPKGISLTNQGVLRLVNHPNYCELSENNVIAQGSNITFDASVFEIWGALLNGAKLVLIDKFSLLNPTELRNIITMQKIDTMIITTSLFNRLSAMDPTPLQGVKQVLFGGEKANLKCVCESYKKLPGCRLVNMYGPSECTVFTTYKNISEKCFEKNEITIGLPISDTIVHIRNTYDGPDLPLGVVGEIMIGGPGIANGYIANDEETKKKFHVDNDGERVYCSGDLAYRDRSGEIVFSGRKDFQVKIRGFRVELGEIKDRLDVIQGIQDSYVTTIECEFGTKQIAAYIKIEENDGQKLTTHDVREKLNQNLPYYMVPTYITVVDQFYFNSSNKIDSSLLPDINFEEVIVLPETEIEKKIYKVWCDLLQVNSVSCDANFFEVGGHSLLAMQMKMQLEKIFGIEIALEKVYSLRRIKDIASYLEQMQNQTGNIYRTMNIKKVERRAVGESSGL